MELSEEEKKAIDNMKSLLLYSKEHEYFSPFQEQEIDDMNIVLNLLEKRQKEIEEYKAKLENERNNCRKFYQEYNKFINDEYKEKIIEQQKEIEELKLDLEEMVKSNNHKLENWVHKNVLNSYIRKDRIRELREIDNIDLIQFKIKELLEEN